MPLLNNVKGDVTLLNNVKGDVKSNPVPTQIDDDVIPTARHVTSVFVTDRPRQDAGDVSKSTTGDEFDLAASSSVPATSETASADARTLTQTFNDIRHGTSVFQFLFIFSYLFIFILGFMGFFSVCCLHENRLYIFRT